MSCILLSEGPQVCQDLFKVVVHVWCMKVNHVVSGLY